MRRILVSLVVLGLFAQAASADEGEATDGIAVLDLRPVRPGKTSKTNLKLLSQAEAATAQLRAAVATATGRNVLSSATMRKRLGARWRVAAFKCAEKLPCLKRIISRLLVANVSHVLVGKYVGRKSTSTIELSLVNLSTLAAERTASIPVTRTGIAPAGLADVVAMFGEPTESVADAAAQDESSDPADTAAPTSSEPPTHDGATPEPVDVASTDTGEDIIETIGGDDDDLPSPAPPPAPPSPDRFQLRGWLRTLADVPGFDSWGKAQQPPDAYAVPHDGLVLRSQLLTHARYARGQGFEATVSGALSYSALEQSPAANGFTFELINRDTSRGVYEASLREMYLGFYSGRFDLRIGQQRVAWGKAEVNSPNDVVNAHDRRDPLLADTELVNIPTPVVRADVDAGFGTLELVLSPFLTPDRFDVYGGNWALVQPDTPQPLRGFFGSLMQGVSPELQASIATALADSGVPRGNLVDPSAGGRFATSVLGFDLSAYYYYGFDSTPNIQFDPAAVQQFAMTDFNVVPASALIGAALGGGMGLPFSVTYVRRHHAGMDLARTIGPLVLRLDAAWDSNRVFLRRDLVGDQSSSWAGVVALEYAGDSLDKLILVEASYQHIVDAPTVPLLFYARDSYGVAVIARWIMLRRLVLELRGLTGIQPVSYALRPELGVKFGAFTFKLGGVVMGGDDGSFGSYFRRNTSVYALARFAF